MISSKHNAWLINVIDQMQQDAVPGPYLAEVTRALCVDANGEFESKAIGNVPALFTLGNGESAFMTPETAKFVAAACEWVSVFVTEYNTVVAELTAVSNLLANQQVVVADSEESRALRKALERSQELALSYKQLLDRDYWIWQGDGTDAPESLVCPIFIQPQQLLKLIGNQQRTENHES